MNELVLHTAADIAALASRFAAEAMVAGDPFTPPLVLVPGAGMARWLGQQVALATGAEGIMAGLDVRRFAALEAAVAGATGEDAWVPERLVWAVLAAAEASDDPALCPVAAHLAANDQRYANALRIARLFAHYADHRPELLRSWSAEPDAAAAALGFDAWQVRLWQALHDAVPDPDPLVRRAALARRLAAGEQGVPWPHVHAFAPRRATLPQRELLRALAGRVGVSVWLPTSGPRDTAHPLGAALGRRGRAWRTGWEGIADRVTAAPEPEPVPTALGRLQAAIRAGVAVSAGPADASVSIHASHGPSRQAEVVREVLTGVFADDPTLEPRHVVIATPRLSELAPHLAAVFGVDANAVGRPGEVHPGTALRVQVAEGAASETNRLYGLLVGLLRLGSTRATASELLALATHPFVARRFGLDADDADRLEELLERAGVRWGLNPEHRARFGLGAFPQSTWQLGVQRLTLGEAFSGDHPTTVGSVATVDDVASTDTDLVGALAELVSRVVRIVRRFGEPGTLAEWTRRLREAIDALVDVPFDQAWQTSQLWSALDTLASRGAASAAPIGAADALALLDGEFAWRVTRPSYGNGSLLVCSLDALAQVPHRVVCLAGLDERTFPRRGLGDGDDLLVREPAADDPDPGADDRQAILDAVLAARERLVVVYQGHSAHTNETHPAPAGVLELIEEFDADAVVHEPLQAFAPANFATDGDGPRSFDATSLRAARALLAERTPAPAVWAVAPVLRTEPLTDADLPGLAGLLRHPVRSWLRRTTGITVSGDDPLPEELPLEVGPLDEWRIGDRMLAALRAGQDLDALVTAEWLSGSVPPGELGRRVVDRVSATVRRIHGEYERAADGPLDAHLVDLAVAGVRVTGRVVTRGGRVADSHYSRIAPRHLADAWVRSLALTASTGERVDAVLVGRRGSERLVAPPPALAERLLADLVALYAAGGERVLPMPPTVAHRWALLRARGEDPLACERQLDADWRHDHDDEWRLVLPLRRKPWRLPRDGDDWGHPAEQSQLGALAALAWAPIVKASGA